jgi:hypothetical protein
MSGVMVLTRSRVLVLIGALALLVPAMPVSGVRYLRYWVDEAAGRQMPTPGPGVTQ